MRSDLLIANGRAQEKSWDWKMLASLGVDEKSLDEANPTDQQLMDLVKGMLYLKEKYPEFWK